MATPTPAPAIDKAKLEAFMGQAVQDMSATISAPLVVIGEKLGLYKAMAGAGPLTTDQVAERSGEQRYIREWLPNHAAGGYVEYDGPRSLHAAPNRRSRSLSRTASLLPRSSSNTSPRSCATRRKIIEAFRTGKGMGWHEHDPALFQGTERFFRPGYDAQSGRDVDSRARRRRRQAQARRRKSPTSAAATAHRRS